MRQGQCVIGHGGVRGIHGAERVGVSTSHQQSMVRLPKDKVFLQLILFCFVYMTISLT